MGKGVNGLHYFIVLLPTNYLFNDMQISEYDITNEIGEHSYTFNRQKIIITIFVNEPKYIFEKN